MKKEENVPFRNYVILAIILILSIAAIIYFYKWYDAYENASLNTSYMDKYLRVINYNEFDNYLMENKDAVLYISVLSDEKTRLFEKKFKNIVNANSLNNSILYLNLDEKEGNRKFFNIYNLNSFPCIVIFRDGKVKNIYSVKNNNYSIDDLNNYLESEGIIDD